MAADAPVVELARAKVNLHLHVTGRVSGGPRDGYHLLDSVVVFPDIADRVEAARANELTLTVEGPFAEAAPTGCDNLVLRAARALGGDGAALRLVKNLPVASGIGGGSADAAAALRALNRLWRRGLDGAALERIGAALGADVPVCLRSRPTVMRGIGDVLAEAPEFGPIPLVLANPGVAVSTPEMFRLRAGPFSEAVDPPAGGDVRDLAHWLGGVRNDLQPAAAARHPEIAAVLAALEALPGVLLARMSGSGATCFGLFETAEDAESAAGALQAAHPEWWVAAGVA